MKTLLKAILILLVIALVWWYAYQEWWIQNPQKLLASIRWESKTIEILNTPQWHIQEQADFEWCLVPDSWQDCETPRWWTVAHSQAVVSYQVNWEWACQTRVSVCNDWNYLADLTPYGLETCPATVGSWNTAVWCQLGSVLVPQWQSLTLYNQPSWDGERWSCDFGERTCEDWELTWNPEFIEFNCYSPSSDFCSLEAELPEEEQEEVIEEETSPVTTTTSIQQVTQPVVQWSREPNCPSPFGWTARAPWQEGTAYSSSQVSFGQTCDAVSIVCAYWSIRYWTKNAPWTIVSTQLATSCSVSQPVWCSSSCGDVDHWETVTTYSQSIIPHGNGQVCDDIKIVSTCTNGTLSPADWWSCACQIAPPAWCIAPNWDKVEHQGSLTLYQYPQVIAVPGDWSDTCVRQWRQCINGWFYDRNGNRADFTYQYRTCEIVEPDPDTWWGPWGEWVPTA
jgi:hypothetical protein